MRSWIVDQFEFDNSRSDERLEVDYAASKGFPFPDASTFVASTVGMAAMQKLGEAVPFDERFAYSLTRSYLRQFTGLELPLPCAWPTYLFSDGPDEWHLVLCGPDCYIRYCWSTSA
jgi:hypothetical protein